MFDSKKLKYFFIPLLVSFLVILSLYKGLFSNLENLIEDRLFSKQPIDNRIIIVAIDDASLAEYGQWPWPRATFADFFEKLEREQPSSVALDVMFAEKSRVGNADDARLTDVLSKISYPLVMPIEIRSVSQAILPLAQFTNNPSVDFGHVNLVVDADGVVRKYQPLQKYQNENYASFGILSAENAGQNLYLENLPPEERIAYASKPGAIKRLSFKDAMERESGFFKDKIVFIGATAPDLHDEQQTPVSNGKLMSGIEIQANIANSKLQGLTLQPLSFAVSSAIILLLSLLSALTFYFLKRVRLIFAANLVILFLTAVFGIILFENGLVINFVHSLLSIILTFVLMFGYRYSVLDKEKREVRKVFEKYVSPQVLSRILQNPENVALGGEEREVTVLFSDIRSFTTLSEKMPPAELIAILNEYFDAMVEEILKHNGVLDKYIGDAIMAFWGAPIDDPLHADNALKASLGMAAALEKLNKSFIERGLPEIKNGIGLYSGPAIVGNVGAKQRFDYTVIGDTVNVASRLEGLCKNYSRTLIIGESTKNLLKENYGDLEQIDTAQVKGRAEPIKIYSLH